MSERVRIIRVVENPKRANKKRKRRKRGLALRREGRGKMRYLVELVSWDLHKPGYLAKGGRIITERSRAERFNDFGKAHKAMIAKRELLLKKGYRYAQIVVA